MGIENKIYTLSKERSAIGYDKLMSISLYINNIMGDKLLLNFGAKFQP